MTGSETHTATSAAHRARALRGCPPPCLPPLMHPPPHQVAPCGQQLQTLPPPICCSVADVAARGDAQVTRRRGAGSTLNHQVRAGVLSMCCWAGHLAMGGWCAPSRVSCPAPPGPRLCPLCRSRSQGGGGGWAPVAGSWESLWAGATRFCYGRAGWNQDGRVHPRLSMLIVSPLLPHLTSPHLPSPLIPRSRSLMVPSPASRGWGLGPPPPPPPSSAVPCMAAHS